MTPPAPPMALLAELTHRCPLACPYCSNPVALTRGAEELDAPSWGRIFREAAGLGIAAVYISLTTLDHALSRTLEPWGGREIVGRADQTSHAMLDNEIKEQRVLGTVLPAIFLGVAAFLLAIGGLVVADSPADLGKAVMAAIEKRK